jgi:hypothetical protein
MEFLLAPSHAFLEAVTVVRPQSSPSTTEEAVHLLEGMKMRRRPMTSCEAAMRLCAEFFDEST